MKKSVAFLGSAMFFVVCISLYLMLETVSFGNTADMLGGEIDSKIQGIEAEIKDNQHKIDELKKNVNELNGERNALVDDEKVSSIKNNFQQVVELAAKNSKALAGDMCTLAEHKPSDTDIQMLSRYDAWSFDNPDGGVWKQGYSIAYDSQRWRKRKLKVIVVPHSHCDPGWIKTFEEYYIDQTRHILNLMVEKLEQHKKMTFIYAEMSFFNLWWNEITSEMKERTKRLLESGRLEIVTGGWVMTDEANAHYFAMLDQLIEGNLWLHNQLGYKPRSGWAIDPFGHAPTMAYLLKEAGLENMLIQRTHYVVKRELSRHQQLEFMWRQNWDSEGKTDMFCHMMPFYSYDVPHTCGPDPKICCQFDFKRLPGGKITCPWHVAPQPINDANVHDKAETLLDQWRKKATLYATDVVLAPLGDDFRYDEPEEWDQQFSNYQRLFDFMNQQEGWDVEARFGTLSDYFTAVHERQSKDKFPVLSGDFFSYADRDDHYWTGYFTSRPFYKALDRVLEANLRSAEILYSVALARARKLSVNSFLEHALVGPLVEARRGLGLFQHHDGITGTAKDHVVADYGTKLLSALRGVKGVISDSAHFLLLDNPQQYNPQQRLLDVDESRHGHDSLPDKTLITLSGEEQPLVFYNSLTHARWSVVRVLTDSAHVQVRDPSGHVVRTQVDPFWVDDSSYSTDKFKVSFVVEVGGVGLAKYSIKKTAPGENPLNTLASITLYGGGSDRKLQQTLFEVVAAQDSIEVENTDLKLAVSTQTGCMETVTMKETGDVMHAQVSFQTYGTVSLKDKSGAYLFMPDGEASPLKQLSPPITVLQGPVMSEVVSKLAMVEHRIRLYNSPGLDALSVDVYNLVDVRSQHNFELVMRLDTGVKNTDRAFYTDLNGYQMIRRVWQKKLPLQGNFYPVPSAMQAEDEAWRVSVLTGQSLGGASLSVGQLELVQDRRLNQDDNRGVGQGVTDNKVTPNRFRILLEKRDGKRSSPEQPAGYLSTTAYFTSNELIHPIHALPAILSAPLASTPLQSSVQFVKSSLPCDLHLVNLRTLQAAEGVAVRSPQGRLGPRATNDTALVLHRTVLDCSFPGRALTCDTSATASQVTLENFFKFIGVQSATSTSLSLIHDRDVISTSSSLNIAPMEIKAYRVQLK